MKAIQFLPITPAPKSLGYGNPHRGAKATREEPGNAPHDTVV